MGDRVEPDAAGEDLSLLGAGGTTFPASPDAARLETFRSSHSGRDYTVCLECPEFTSLCPITGQPDFAHLFIEYIPDMRCVESKSLKLYLFSFRNYGGFSEAIVNRVLDDLVAACEPRYARVTGRFAPRGGIGITVVAEFPAPSGRPSIPGSPPTAWRGPGGIQSG